MLTRNVPWALSIATSTALLVHFGCYGMATFAFMGFIMVCLERE